MFIMTELSEQFRNLSGIEIKPVYTAADIPPDLESRLGTPGKPPFTRGIHEDMYRGQLWTMRMFAGFGKAEDTNKRFKFLLERGQTGLSTAFSIPTLMGRDSDDPLSAGEAGLGGVEISSLEDMEKLFDGIPLDEVTVSMTINAPAAYVKAMFIAMADKREFSRNKLRGTLQNDALKEYFAQNEVIIPPRPAFNLVLDTIEYDSRHLPNWNSVSISGYHIREAGSTAIQELTFTLMDGLAYVDGMLNRGASINSFAPRLSFFFNAHNDFFEEIAKYRAARKIWSQEIAKRGGSERSQWCRMHVQTAGVSLTAQQPYNNIIRVAYQALAAALGGAQSIHTDSFDEALCLPTEHAVTLALRTQQILAHETGVVNTVDPLGGSYYVEWLTAKMEEEFYKLSERVREAAQLSDKTTVDEIVLRGIEKGFFVREIHKASYEYQKAVEAGTRVIVGVNAYKVPPEEDVVPKIFRIDQTKIREERRVELARLRVSRDDEAVKRALAELETAARAHQNIMGPMINAAKAYVTIGEVTKVLQGVHGIYNLDVA